MAKEKNVVENPEINEENIPEVPADEQKPAKKKIFTKENLKKAGKTVGLIGIGALATVSAIVGVDLMKSKKAGSADADLGDFSDLGSDDGSES